MPSRIYLLPFEQTFSVDGSSKRYPKYHKLVNHHPCSMQDLGDSVLMVVEDIEDAEHDALVANPDCIFFPKSLKTPIAGDTAALSKSLGDGKLATKPRQGDSYEQFLRKLVVEVAGEQGSIEIGSVTL